MSKMNLPNKLTVFRIFMVPVFIVVMMLPASVLSATVSGIVGVVLFVIASLTDMLDGKIARRYGLVTDFGKLMDPLADKFMVIGALTAIVYRATDATRFLFVIVLLVVVFRELAVTSLRRVASSWGGKVVAANMIGKFKTVCQIVFLVVAILEPIVYGYVSLPDMWETNVPLSYVFGGLTVILTVWSGINYFVGLWQYLDPEK